MKKGAPESALIRLALQGCYQYRSARMPFLAR